MSEGVNITVYEGKSTQEAANKAEAAKNIVMAFATDIEEVKEQILSTGVGLPENFPEVNENLSATVKDQWTILIPGSYNKVQSGKIFISDNEFAFAQFDGVDFNNVKRVNIPMQDISGLLPKGNISADNLVNIQNMIFGIQINIDNVEVTNDEYVTIGYIPVNPELPLRHKRGLSGAETILCFNVDGVHLGNIQGNGSYDKIVTLLPATRFVRTNVSRNKLTREADISTFGLFQDFSQLSSVNTINGRGIVASKVANSSIITDKSIYISTKGNIYSVCQVEDDNYIYNDGKIGEGSSLGKKNYSLARIPITTDKGSHISFLRSATSGTFGWFMNADQEPLSPIINMNNILSGVLKIPSGTAWLFVNVSNDPLKRELQKNHFTIVYSNLPISEHLTQPSISGINYLINHPLSGKKIIAIGDSITTYERIGTNERNESSNYFIRACSGMGAFMLQNYSIGGSTISQRASDPETRNPIAIRYADMRDDADVVIVSAGTNDCTHSWTTLGVFEDSTVNTFYGALHVLCQGLKLKYIGKTIVFITPIRRYAEFAGMTTPTSQNANGETPVQYVDAIVEVCNFYGIPVLDNYRRCPLNPFFEPYRDIYMNDGTHPNAEGHKIMAEGLVNFLRST